MPTEHYVYSFFRIAKHQAIASSAKKYKQLRLHALSVAPGSFSSTYGTESALTDAEWATRLATDGKETFICAATPVIKTNPSDVHVPEPQSVWVGQLTLRGPQSREDFILPEESGQKKPGEEEAEELWQMLSLFTLPDHRGQGLGKKLCQVALNYLASCRQSPREV